MASTPPKRRGRPAKYVKDKDGKPIVGLSLSSQGRYYATHSKPRKTFGSDFDKAVRAFRRWQGEQEREAPVAIPIESPAGALQFPLPTNFLANVPKPEDQLPAAAAMQEVLADGDESKLKQLITQLPTYRMFDSKEVYDWVREQILTDPAAFAERVGIPEIARLEHLQERAHSPTLKAVLATYVEHADITQHERQRAERYWKEFCKFAKGSTVREVTQQQIVNYGDWALNEHRNGKSRPWVHHRFGKIKTLFNYAATRGLAPDEMARVLAMCKVLKSPRKKAADPQPISREDFHALLNAANAKWKAILLCMLNAALYGKEVGDLLTKEVDLKKGTLATDRSKTGVPRVAVLWGRTITALKAAPRKAKHSHLFQNSVGTPYQPEQIRRGFNRLREAAGVSKDVKVSHIRDGAYTAAIEGGADATHAMLLAGHAAGMKDAYVRRNPKMVADACAAIEKAYFG